MKTVFFHDNYITQKNGRLYSNGSLNQKVILRYLAVFDEFTLATRANSNRPIEKLSFVATEKHLNYQNIENIASLSYRNFSNAKKKISALIDKHDFIITRLPSFIGYLAAYYCIIKRKKFAVELVGSPLDTYWNYGNIQGKLIAYPFHFYTKYIASKANNILYVTSSFLQSNYPSKASNQINCSNVEISISQEALDKRLRKLSRISRSITLGMIGALTSKYKGFDTALKAMKLLVDNGHDEFLLEIVGGGSQEKLNLLIKQYKLSPRVKIIGTLPHPEGIFSWLDSIDIFIHPSRVEGLPRALIEAMSRACACIGSNAGGIPELLPDTFIHEKNNYKELAEKILRLRNRNILIDHSITCFNAADSFDKQYLDKKRESFYLKANS